MSNAYTDNFSISYPLEPEISIDSHTNCTYILVDSCCTAVLCNSVIGTLMLHVCIYSSSPSATVGKNTPFTGI